MSYFDSKMFEQFKPKLIKYLINMTGCPITYPQIAKSLGVSHVTARHWLDALVDSGDVDRVERILQPSKKVLSSGHIYYVNNISIITNQNALHRI